MERNIDNELFSLKGKNIILFGGNGLLGKHFTKVLSDFGAKVISCDIIENIDKISNVDYYVFDAGNEEELLNYRDEIINKYEHIDVLVNSVTSKYKDFYLPFDEVSLEGWEIGIKGNLTVPFMTCKAFIPIMVKQNGGSIINISSVYGVVGNDQSIYEGSNLHEIYVKDSPDIKQIYSHGVYNASKAGLNNFGRYLASYYGKNNIRVNTISPGGVEFYKENDVFMKKYSAKTPLGRKAKPNEMNGVLVLLASDASSYITGQNILVDGGFTAW
jgi:NAD(P)-dependent dehydrogenase (short-subunit alcohol dehydrogenase family)